MWEQTVCRPIQKPCIVKAYFVLLMLLTRQRQVSNTEAFKWSLQNCPQEVGVVNIFGEDSVLGVTTFNEFKLSLMTYTGP